MSVPMVPVLLTGLVALAGGVYFLVWGRRQARTAHAFGATALPAQAVVTDLRLRHQTHNQEHDDGYWVPVVRFVLPDGRQVEAETLVGSMPAPAKVGDRVPVRYDPADPHRVNLSAGRAQPASLGCLWTTLGSVLVGLGLLVLLVWVVLWRLLGVGG